MAFNRTEILCSTENGLYCAAGDFYIDPWKPVDRAVITHAHSDHARWGMGRYLCAREGELPLRIRVGSDAKIDSVEYGERLVLGSAMLSLHPAGHIIGSSQVRIEVDGFVAVVSGDYKTEPDPSCTAFELVKCHLFVTESTFGLPIYRWPESAKTMDAVCEWWRRNQASGKCSVIFGYALGKSQRILMGIDPTTGPIVVHGAVERMTSAYRASGFNLPPTFVTSQLDRSFNWTEALVVAPPSALGSTWLRRFGTISTAFASGWMAVRGARRRRSVDRGFVISDHVDWPSLLHVIGETGAERVWVTHGYSSTVVRYLEEHGIPSEIVATIWEGETNDTSDIDDAAMEGDAPQVSG